MKKNIPNLVGFKISRPVLNSILNFGTFLGSFVQNFDQNSQDFLAFNVIFRTILIQATLHHLINTTVSVALQCVYEAISNL